MFDVRPRRSSGFTLIEMLVSLVITLIMMLGVVTLFQVMTDSVSGSRALLETADRLRACRNRLQLDLQGATATMLPPLRPEADEGYFEIGEGRATDGNSFLSGFNGSTLFGDTDDYLAFTVRSRGEPFVGKFLGTPSGTIESQVAEVMYFLGQSTDTAGNLNGPIIDATTTPPARLFTLYRRVLLVMPGLGTNPNLPVMPAAGAATLNYYDNFDVSARYSTATATMIANSLGDLTKRENRFAHYGATPFPSTFPFSLWPSKFPSLAGNPPLPPDASNPNRPNSDQAMQPFSASGGRLGDDVLLTNVVAFDVQVWDPGAPVFIPAGTNVAVEPRDAGYNAQITAPAPVPSAFGAYADLGYGPTYGAAAGSPNPLFNGIPNPRSGIISPPGRTKPYVYDTWSLHYENDGLLQFTSQTGIADAGTNGLDDIITITGVADGVVDDLGEYDTIPPYPAQLRGVRITVRVYEPSSQQIREIVVTQDFLPD